jgi:hypothetical protein
MLSSVRKSLEKWATTQQTGVGKRNCCRKCRFHHRNGRCHALKEHTYDPIKGTSYFHPLALYVRMKQSTPEGLILQACQYYAPTWWVELLGLKYD